VTSLEVLSQVFYLYNDYLMPIVFILFSMKM